MEQIEIIKPDDWHVHFRDNDILNAPPISAVPNFIFRMMRRMLRVNNPTKEKKSTPKNIFDT